MWKPKRDLIIPVKSIIKIENPKSDLDKSIYKPLLKVNFKNDDGKDDSTAWFVRTLDKWNEIFKNLIPKRT